MANFRRSKQWLIGILILAATACREGTPRTEIRDILDNPRKFVGKTVTVEGTVTENFSLLLFHTFKVTAGEDGIFVLTSQPLPRENTRVEVTGIVRYYAIGGEEMVVIQEEVGD